MEGTHARGPREAQVQAQAVSEHLAVGGDSAQVVLRAKTHDAWTRARKALWLGEEN